MKNRIISSLFVVTAFFLGFAAHGMQTAQQTLNRELKSINANAQEIQESVNNVANAINQLMQNQPQIKQIQQPEQFSGYYNNENKKKREKSPEYHNQQNKNKPHGGNNIVQVYAQDNIAGDAVVKYLNQQKTGLTFEKIDNLSEVSGGKGAYIFFNSTRWDAYFDTEKYKDFNNKSSNTIVIMLQYGYAEQAKIPETFENKTATIWVTKDGNDEWSVNKTSTNLTQILNKLK